MLYGSLQYPQSEDQAFFKQDMTMFEQLRELAPPGAWRAGVVGEENTAEDVDDVYHTSDLLRPHTFVGGRPTLPVQNESNIGLLTGRIA